MVRKYRMMGFTSRDNGEFICMYGCDTTLEEDVERFRFLRSLPGAYVFVQAYQPIPGGPEPDLSRLFDARADQLIDDLIGIVFTQNMKSMEKYCRWLSRPCVLSFGVLHRRLVDTIFRYNARDRKNPYLAKIAKNRKLEIKISYFSLRSLRLCERSNHEKTSSMASLKKSVTGMKYILSS